MCMHDIFHIYCDTLSHLIFGVVTLLLVLLNEWGGSLFKLKGILHFSEIIISNISGESKYIKLVKLDFST